MTASANVMLACCLDRQRIAKLNRNALKNKTKLGSKGMGAARGGAAAEHILKSEWRGLEKRQHGTEGFCQNFCLKENGDFFFLVSTVVN